MMLRGSLKKLGISSALQAIGTQSLTGTLHLLNGPLEVRLRFVAGNFHSSETVGRRSRELLGRALVRAEIITEKELQSALEVQKRTLKRLGDVLVSSDVISDERLFQMVQLQALEATYRVFFWRKGSYRFEPEEIGTITSPLLALTAGDILSEGLRRIHNWPQIRRTLDQPGMIFIKLKPLPAVADKSKSILFETGVLGENESTMYYLATPSRRIDTLIDLSCLGDFEASKALFNLTTLGYLKPSTRKKRGSSSSFRLDRRDWFSRISQRILRAGGVGAMLTFGIGWGLSLGHFSLPRAVGGLPELLSPSQQRDVEDAVRAYRWEKGVLPGGLEDLVSAGLLTRVETMFPWSHPFYYLPLSSESFELLPPIEGLQRPEPALPSGLF